MLGLKDFLALRSDSQPGLLTILLSKMASFNFSNYSSLLNAMKAFLAHMGTAKFLDSLAEFRGFVR